MGQITLNEITKVYESGNVTAVDGIDLTIEDGEFFSLLGPSGCGKTTTLRMISGFETPTEGRLHIDDRDVTIDPPEERPTNMVFQNLALFSHMDVYDNVAYGLKRSGVATDEIDERVAESLELVDMGGYEDRHITELSGGQQQRIAVARALTNRTDVILLDEPLSSLDRKLRQQMQLELRTIHEEVGMTFFYVTHDQEVAMTMSDRIAVMNDGQIEQVGPPTEVYNNPVSEFVANFIGDINTFRGELVDDRFRTDDGHEFAIPENIPVRANGGAEAQNPSEDGTGSLVVRPEKLQIDPSDPDVDNTLDGVVRDVVFRGSTTQYDIEVGERVLDVETQNLTRSPPYSLDDSVTVGWEPDAAIVYWD
jgi:spermidine/putrescine transport system ATP-binding protein